jgi:hypothetical protein
MEREHATRRSVAHHEAAHAVINYRVAGHVGGETTIIPNPDAGTLGHNMDGCSDSYNEEHMRARVLSLYAGAHAERQLGVEPNGYGADEDEAARLLSEWGWEAHEQRLRDESRELVTRHWHEIVAVADELLRVNTLDDVELESLADIAAGGAEDLTPAEIELELQRYRVLRSLPIR